MIRILTHWVLAAILCGAAVSKLLGLLVGSAASVGLPSEVMYLIVVVEFALGIACLFGVLERSVSVAVVLLATGFVGWHVAYPQVRDCGCTGVVGVGPQVNAALAGVVMVLGSLRLVREGGATLDDAEARRAQR